MKNAYGIEATEITAEQNSDEWYQARAGLITASRFETLFMTGRFGGPSETKKKYMFLLAGERITGKPEETFSNARMEDGHAKEIEAADWYGLTYADADVRECGFFRSDDLGGFGASPDRLVGDDGLLEIKSHKPSVLIAKIESGNLYDKGYYAQVQGQLLVTGRKWCDFFPFWPGMPKKPIRILPDPDYIESLKAAIEQFNADLEALVSRIKAYGNV